MSSASAGARVWGIFKCLLLELSLLAVVVAFSIVPGFLWHEFGTYYIGSFSGLEHPAILLAWPVYSFFGGMVLNTYGVRTLVATLRRVALSLVWIYLVWSIHIAPWSDEGFAISGAPGELEPLQLIAAKCMVMAWPTVIIAGATWSWWHRNRLGLRRVSLAQLLTLIAVGCIWLALVVSLWRAIDER